MRKTTLGILAIATLTIGFVGFGQLSNISNMVSAATQIESQQKTDDKDVTNIIIIHTKDTDKKDEKVEESKIKDQKTDKEKDIDTRKAEEEKEREKAKEKAEAERKAKEEAEKKAEAERKAKEEAEKKAEKERKAREEAEKKAEEEKQEKIKQYVDKVEEAFKAGDWEEVAKRLEYKVVINNVEYNNAEEFLAVNWAEQDTTNFMKDVKTSYENKLNAGVNADENIQDAGLAATNN